MKSGIYAWKLDGIYKYIGYGLDVEDRMFDRHRGNPYICEYDYDLFEKIIICYCEVNETRKLETYYIKKLHTHVSDGGFNCNYGGGGCTEQTAETKQKISDAMSGEKHPWFGKHHSEESKQKLSKAHKGKHLLEETKKKIGDGNRGKIVSDDTKQKMRLARIGKPLSEETKRKMSENHIDVVGENNPNFGIKKSNSSSEYFGITKTMDKNKYIYYRTRIVDNGIQIDLGNFKNEIDAAKAWDKYVIEHNLPNPLNFPKDYK